MKKETKKKIIKGGLIIAGISGVLYACYKMLPDNKDIGSIVPGKNGYISGIPKDTVLGLKLVNLVDGENGVVKKAVAVVDIAEEIKADWGVESTKTAGVIFGTVEEIKKKFGIDLEKAEFLEYGLNYIPGEFKEEDIINDLNNAFVVRQKLGFFKAFWAGAKHIIGRVPMRLEEEE